MTLDIQELKRLAEAADGVSGHSYESHKALARYSAAASPSTILALIEENERLRAMASIETKGSLPWWIQRAANHAEDMGEEGFLIDRDHWERIVFAAQTEVARTALEGVKK